MSLGSNVMDRARSLQKILTRLCGTNFCINMVLQVSRSDETVPNAPKQYKMMCTGSVRCENLKRDFVARTFLH